MQDIKFAVHAHPTLSEVLDELFKAAKVYIDALISCCYHISWSTNLNNCKPHSLFPTG